MAVSSDDNWLDDQLAAMLAPPGTRYIMVCRECRTGWYRKRDCQTTKAVRRGDATCPTCGENLEMVLDPKEDESQ